MTFIKRVLAIKSYKIGLSLLGIAAVILVMLPNVVYFFYTPPTDPLSGNNASYWLWNTIENIGRFGLMTTLCIVVNKTASTQSRIIMTASACSLIAYYVLWIAYFAGAFNGLSLVGMALFPSIFFLLIAWRLRNGFALAFGTLFAVVHIAVTGSNFLF